MGLNTQASQGGRTIFLNITNGKLVRQMKEKTDKSVERTNKMGRLVHEEFYDSMDGLLVGIDTKESEYGKFWVISLKSGDETYKLEVNYSSGYAVSFLKTLPNVDLSKQVTVTPRLIIDGDKKSSVIFVAQGGKALKHFWNKDNPGELPQLEKIKVKGKETWDDSKRLEYLENYAKEYILKANAVSQDIIADEEAPF